MKDRGCCILSTSTTPHHVRPVVPWKEVMLDLRVSVSGLSADTVLQENPAIKISVSEEWQVALTSKLLLPVA